jgi:hypothetical protein
LEAKVVSWQQEKKTRVRSAFTIGEIANTLQTGEHQVRALLYLPDGHNPYELVSRKEVLKLAGPGGEIARRLEKLLKG